MRKIIFIFFISNILIINVYASTPVTNYIEINEEVINYNNDNIDILLTIPSNYKEDIATINTSIFNSINHFRLLDSNNKKIKVNLIIDNKSNYIYKYNNDSLRLFISNNNNKIYRTKNSALKKLFNNKKIKLDDLSINKRLNKLGYNSLDKYYLDFYNNKYNNNYTDIKDFNPKIKKELFKYSDSTIIETNTNINKVSIDYYNKELVKVIINNRAYSLEECLNYYIDDSEFTYYFNNIYDKAVVSIYIELDNDYNDLFINYLKGSMYFTLNKISLK